MTSLGAVSPTEDRFQGTTGRCKSAEQKSRARVTYILAMLEWQVRYLHSTCCGDCMSKLSLIVFVLVSLASWETFGSENLDCMMCHKHRGLSRIDEDGEFHLFYINEELFHSGPHRRIECEDCHGDIDRIPHDSAEMVDCTRTCHIKEPSGGRNFSHQSIAETLEKSVHGRFGEDGTLKPYPDDYPGCKDCHEQPLYRPFSIYKGEKVPGISERGISRCQACHTSSNFAEDFYEHVTSRLQKTRFPMETIDICAKCHADPAFLERHDLHDAVASYKQTFHGKLMTLGSERTPDCIDCHVVVGENTHLIEDQTEPTSAVHENNKSRTCREAECHTGAAPQLAEYRTHVFYSLEKYPMEFYLMSFFKGL
ncbi:MAG: hypothetical protein HUJ31_03685 [Pseudomonadales bacterium]|nr:hypothetical protein [Pseudomonadales bacterium]